MFFLPFYFFTFLLLNVLFTFILFYLSEKVKKEGRVSSRQPPLLNYNHKLSSNFIEWELIHEEKSTRVSQRRNFYEIKN